MNKLESTLAGRVRTLALILLGLTTTGCGLLTSDEVEATVTVDEYEFSYDFDTGEVSAALSFVVRNTGDRPIFLELGGCGPRLERRQAWGWSRVDPDAICTAELNMLRVDPGGIYRENDFRRRFRYVASEAGEPLPAVFARGSYRLVLGAALVEDPTIGDGDGGLFASNPFAVP